MADTVSSEIYTEANYISTKKANTDGSESIFTTAFHLLMHYFQT